MGIELSDVVSFEVEGVNTQSHNITLKLVTKDDFKIYQENLVFEFVADGSLPQTLNYTGKPNAKRVLDPFSNTKKYIFENGTSFALPVSGNMQGGERLDISVQACSAGVCLLPSRLQVVVEDGAKSTVASQSSFFSQKDISSQARIDSSVPAQTSNRINPPTYTSELQVPPNESNLSAMVLKFLQNGSLFLFPLLLLAGFLTNLTPCVYPMIPITIGVMNQFGKHSHSKLKISLVYVFGMVITYSLLGVIAAMTGQVFGSQLASPVFSVVIASIMILLGLAMLNFFDLSFLQRLSYKIPFTEKNPMLAVFTMGTVSGLVAAPCTGPILSMILVLIAQTRNPITGFLYMVIFALGFGAPYILLGLASQKLTKLPKMHRTSEIIKLIFACLMFGLALYFLKLILSNSSFFNFFYVKPKVSDIIGVGVLLFLFSGIKRPKFKFLSTLSYVGVVGLLSLLCLWLTLWLSNAFINPYRQNSSATFEEVLKTSQIHWQTDLDFAMRSAREQNKKILIDVWAEWCTACLEMEATTWQDNKIIKVINKNFVPVKLDYTHPSQILADQLSSWQIVGLPAILILDPAQKNKPIEVYQGIVSTPVLLQKLSAY